MNDKIFVDTNILVYARDTTEPTKHSKASDWLRYLWSAESGRLSLQVLTEYYAVVTKKLSRALDAQQAREDIEDLLAWQPAPLTAEILVQAWRFQDQFQLSWWDALIVASAKQMRCNYLLSEDFQHGQDYQGIRVISPFRVEPESYSLADG